MTVPSEIVVMRFTRVIFGVFPSPFLLNATIDNHMEKFKSIDQPFVEKFCRSIYVDDLTEISSKTILSTTGSAAAFILSQ